MSNKPYIVVLHPDTPQAHQAADFADLGAAMTYCGMLDEHLNINADIYVMRGGQLVLWIEAHSI